MCLRSESSRFTRRDLSSLVSIFGRLLFNKQKSYLTSNGYKTGVGKDDLKGLSPPILTILSSQSIGFDLGLRSNDLMSHGKGIETVVNSFDNWTQLI